MITSGLYRHYKGPLYRVLFIAEWARLPPAGPDAPCYVQVVDNTLWVSIEKKVGPGPRVVVAKWSGNDNEVVTDDHVVIYVSLSEHGRVSARTEKEFEEEVEIAVNGTGYTLSRFDRIGD